MMQKMLPITRAAMRSAMNTEASVPVWAAYICDIGIAPTPRPPAMIGPATKRIPSTKPNPSAAAIAPMTAKVMTMQPRRGTRNRGPALSNSARGMPRTEPAMTATTKKSRKP